MNTVESYPLYWPIGWARAKSRSYSRFRTAFARARNNLLNEIRRMGGTKIILSTNIPLTRDELPYAKHRVPSDPGVAVYFDYKGRPMSFACDKWIKVEDNIYSICLTIEALRGIERWGASDMMERAFTGFAQLEAPRQERAWYVVLNCRGDASPDEITRAFKAQAKANHPDAGGSNERMSEINGAYARAREFKNF